MLLYDGYHLSVKTDFLKRKLFLVCFIYLIPSSQNFATFLSKTDEVIKI